MVIEEARVVYATTEEEDVPGRVASLGKHPRAPAPRTRRRLRETARQDRATPRSGWYSSDGGFELASQLVEPRPPRHDSGLLLRRRREPPLEIANQDGLRTGGRTEKKPHPEAAGERRVPGARRGGAAYPGDTLGRL